MSFRYWLLHPPIGALIIIFLALFAVGLTNHYRDNQCGENAPANVGERACTNMEKTAIAPIRSIEPPPPNPNPDREEWRKENDLKAQWDMADSTKSAAVATWFGFIAAALALVVLKLTLDANQEAVTKAGKAAAAAQEANEIMRQGNRPWLKIKLTPNAPLYIDNECIRFELLVALTNVGERPATRVIFHTDQIKIDFGYALNKAVPEFINSIYTHKQHIAWGHTIFPNDTFKWKYGISANIDEMIVANDKSPLKGRDIFFICCATYTTIDSNNWYHTAAIYRIAPADKPKFKHGWRLTQLYQAQSIS